MNIRRLATIAAPLTLALALAGCSGASTPTESPASTTASTTAAMAGMQPNDTMAGGAMDHNRANTGPRQSMP
jgi:PBP1b-binding outer membrane lipoprotein LpoB